jgi:MarR family
MESWSFLTNHARVLLCIAHDPDARLRDIAASLGITDRSVYGIVTDLTAAGYVVKHRDGRRSRYQIQAHLPLPEPASKEPAIGEVLALLMDNRARQQRSPAFRRAGMRGLPSAASLERAGEAALG